MNPRKDELDSLIELSHRDLVHMFKDISRHFVGEMFYDVHVNHSEVILTVKENVVRWSDEVVRVYFRLDSFLSSKTKEMTVDFNHGSGGWNSGSDAADCMDVQVAGFSAAKQAIAIARANETELKRLQRLFMSLNNELSEIYAEERKAQNDQVELETRRKLAVLTGHMLLQNPEDFMEALEEKEYASIDVLTFHVNGDTFRPTSIRFTKDAYGDRKVFKRNNQRVSKKAIMQEARQEHMYIPVNLNLAKYQLDRIAHISFKDADEFFAKVAEITARF
jgi:hypothetical protein